MMSFLRFLCPVKLFDNLINDDYEDLVCDLGMSVAFTGFTFSLLMVRLGNPTWLNQALVTGVVGSTTAILASEIKSIRAKKRAQYGVDVQRLVQEMIKEKVLPEPEQSDSLTTKVGLSLEDTQKAVECLAGDVYWNIWKDRFDTEAHALNEPKVYPNIPYEFAFAFGHSLMKVLEHRLKSRVTKICDMDDDLHYRHWEYTTAISALSAIERSLYSETIYLVKTYKSEDKAQNRGGANKKAELPLLYCRIMQIIKNHYGKYKEVLEKHRAKMVEKNEKITQEMQSLSAWVESPLTPSRRIRSPASSSESSGSASPECSTEQICDPEPSQRAQIPLPEGHRMEDELRQAALDDYLESQADSALNSADESQLVDEALEAEEIDRDSDRNSNSGEECAEAIAEAEDKGEQSASQESEEVGGASAAAAREIFLENQRMMERAIKDMESSAENN